MLSKKITKTSFRLFLIGFVILVAGSFYSFYRIKYQNRLAERVNHTNVVKLELQKTYAHLLDANAQLHTFLLTRDSIYFDRLMAAEEKIRLSVKLLKELVSDNPAQRNRIDKLDSTIQTRHVYMENDLSGKTAHYGGNAEQIKRCNENIGAAISAITAEEELLLDAREKEQAEYQTITPLVMLAVKLFTIMLLAFTLWHLLREFKIKDLLQHDLASKNELLQKTNHDLMRQKDFNQAILDSSMSLIAVYDKHQRYISFNRECEIYLGKKATDVLGKTFPEVWPDRESSPIYRDVQKAFKGERVRNLQYQAISPGRYFESQTIPLFDANNQVHSVVCIAHETTHVIEAQQALEKLNAELTVRKEFAETLLDNSVDIISVLDTALKFISFNRKAAEVYAMTPDMIGKRLLDVFPTAYNSATHRGLEDALKGNPVYNLKHHSVLLDKFFESFFIPLKANDEVYAVMMIHHDVTAIHVASEKLHERNLELERSNQALEQFAYVASHDMREPLRKIRTFATMAGQSLHDPERAVGYLGKIFSSAERMANLIQDVLNYSLINRNNEPAENVDLNAILRQVETDLELVISSKNATITYPSLPVVHGSSLQLAQLFMNLISNSLKFSVDVPAITITCELALNQFFPVYNYDSDYYKISVTDNGIGFEQQYAEHVFEVFRRLHPQSEFKGTGIGLAICRRIVQHHQGVITATSEPGKGSTFTIYLPMNPVKINVQNATSEAPIRERKSGTHDPFNSVSA